MNDQDNTFAPSKNQASSLSKKERGTLVATHKKHILWQVERSRASLIERSIMIAMLKMYWSRNQGLDYLTGAKDGIPIYPGVEKLCYIVGCSERSVRSALKVWRDAGVLVATSHAKGGRNSTRYLIKQDLIWRLADRNKPCTNPAQTLHKPCINPAKFADGKTILVNGDIEKEDGNQEGLIVDFSAYKSNGGFA